MVEQILGAVLGILVLIDIFFLVLYARAETGLVSKWVSRLLWSVLVWVSRPLGRRRGSFLTLAGPIILITVIATWVLLLIIASALIIRPTLGIDVRTLHGETPTDFITALFAAGGSLDFVSESDFVALTPLSRMYYLLSTLIGISVVTLTITYILEIYTNLKERNTHGLKVELLTGQTGDAAEALAHLGPRGRFDIAFSNIVDWAAETVSVSESHHFYPALLYFRFREPYYSVSRTALVSLDTVALLRTTLDDEEYGWLKESSAVDDLERGTMLELKILARIFVSKVDLDVPPDPQTRERWQRRYAAGAERLRCAGIKTTESQAEEYVSMRTRWDRYITLIAPKFAYEMDEIDTTLAKVK